VGRIGTLWPITALWLREVESGSADMNRLAGALLSKVRPAVDSRTKSRPARSN
jgi:hypothetical protein